MTVAERFAEETGYAPGWQPLWQPIATAPRDGEWILGCGSSRPHEFDLAEPELVRWQQEDWRDIQCIPHECTHWMPIPGPPT